MSADKPSPEQFRRAFEQSEEGDAQKIGEPRGVPEPGEIVVGPVDAGPTGDRDGGYREATSGGRILAIVAGVLIVIAAVLALVLLR
jgi:hypothetical protein